MARKAVKTAAKKSTGLVVPDGTILVNCMTPCAKCDKLKPYITSAVRTWAKKQGYSITINSVSNNAPKYWQTYGKPGHVGQTTPQMYVVKTQEKFAGVAVNPGTMIGDYKIPEISSWSSTMVKEIISALISLC